MDKKDKEKITKKILYTSFNQSGIFFSIGTENGFQIYKSNPLQLKVDKSKNIYLLNN